MIAHTRPRPTIRIAQRRPLVLDARCCGYGITDVNFHQVEPGFILVTARCPRCHAMFGTKVDVSDEL